MTQRPFILTLVFIGLFTLGVNCVGSLINANAAGVLDLDHQQRELQLNSQDLQRLIADTGAGSLTIMGVEGLTQIKVTADIYTNSHSEVTLTLETTGANDATLIAQVEDSGLNAASAYIDLNVQVPAQLALDINDGSGAILINKMMADIKLVDGSGEIEIQNGQNLDITDGSGAIKLSQINGTVKMNDGSGSINATHISGEMIIKDGSGDIKITDVQSSVTITDGSGDINVANTKGLTILAAGSGDVNFDRIDGPVSSK